MKYLSGGQFICVRMPDRPLNDILELFEAEKDSYDYLKKYILSQSASGKLMEAIGAASPDLYTGIKKWKSGNLPQHKEHKLLLSIYKYLSRSSARSTPFGIFAGYAAGNISPAASNLLFKESDPIIYTRLDMGYTIPLVQAIAEDVRVYRQLNYSVNRSVYEVNGRYRFYQYDLNPGNSFYKIESIPKSPLLKDIITWARQGAGYSRLIELVLPYCADLEGAQELIHMLVKKQFLISELYPRVTGGLFFDHLISTLNKLEGVEDLQSDMESVRLNMEKSGTDPAGHDLLKEVLERYIPVSSKKILQHDLSWVSDKTINLSNSVTEELKDNLNDILVLGEQAGNFNLREFKRRFTERYGEKEMPLLEVLDPLYGIGYVQDRASLNEIAPALKDLSLPGKKKQAGFSWGNKHQYLLGKINEAQVSRSKKIVLSASDIQQLSNHQDELKLPQSMYVLGSFLAKSTEEMDSGNFQFLVSYFGGPSAGCLLTRFCLQDEALNKAVLNCLDTEQDNCGDAILAEVAHLPEPRLGNVMMRPDVRKFEIPLITQTGIGKESEIPLEDILVSIRGEKIILLSKRLNKEIIPRLTTAHNFSNGIPVYRFLGDLQFQEFNFFNSWDWSPFQNQPYLPRIEYKKLILQRSRWLLKSSEYQDWARHHPDSEFCLFLEKMARDFDLPDQAVLKEGDHELLLNLRSGTGQSIVAEQLAGKDVLLYEFLFNSDNCIVRRDNQDFVHEIIIPFISVKDEQKKSKPVKRRTHIQSEETFNFVLGSEWLYFKIYLDFNFADQLIAEALGPLCNELITDRTIDQWFFIRYKDPDHHIRLRFHHGTDVQFWKTVIDRMNEVLRPFISGGMVHKLMTDTYEQEVLRYGADRIRLVEQLFYRDSAALVKLLTLLYKEGKEEYRLLLALKNIDLLMDEFSLTTTDKQRLAVTLSEFFYQEHNTDSKSKKLRVSLDQKYRAARAGISDTMEGLNTDLAPYFDCLHWRAQYNRPVIDQLTEVLEASGNTDAVSSLISSFIHMTMNRVFNVNQRQHEMVVYHHLSKYYETKIAREAFQHTL